MAIRFDHNNNSEEWQMLFDKINNGSPFGVITFNKLLAFKDRFYFCK
ncbi:hypothetical protein [Helicobacter pylori]|nr:hypothetical protein [Helicobacter pylori]QQW80622.1 hypothetical protein HG572_02955 [Helicobacter pylori]QQW86388.1 hypothetical protein HG567_02950 [Helicobacter pylori]WQW70034.1 hypothetical protein KVM29_02965 [Helicobacter pylori]